MQTYFIDLFDLYQIESCPFKVLVTMKVSNVLFMNNVCKYLRNDSSLGADKVHRKCRYAFENLLN